MGFYLEQGHALELGQVACRAANGGMIVIELE